MPSSRRFPSSIRDRILLPYLALTVGMVAVTGLACGHWAAERAWEQGLERGRSLAETLRRSTFPLTEPVLEQLRGLGGVEFALLDDRGRVEASTLAPEGLASLGRSLAPDLSFRAAWSSDTTAYRVAVVERPRYGAQPQRLLILLPEPALHAAAWEARRAALVLSVVGAALAALLAAVLGRNLARPLAAVAAAIRGIAAGDRHPNRLPIDRDDEIGDLARGVSRLAERLDQLERERVQTERLHLVRQVSAGLAHEIRNPLTAARMTLQLFMERNPDRDPEPLRVALNELQRVERQVGRFLQLARPEPPRPVQVALGPLLHQVAAGLAASAEHQGVCLRVEPDPDENLDPQAPALADPDQLAQVVANLARNAIEAAGPGGTVRLLASDTSIVVEDDGPGVAPGDRDRLFQPFFTTKPEGVGLGLALCDALVREAGGSIRHDRLDGLTRFLVELPDADASRDPVGPA